VKVQMAKEEGTVLFTPTTPALNINKIYRPQPMREAHTPLLQTTHPKSTPPLPPRSTNKSAGSRGA
jgi:hypothetical protein